MSKTCSHHVFFFDACLRQERGLGMNPKRLTTSKSNPSTCIKQVVNLFAPNITNKKAKKKIKKKNLTPSVRSE